jgi:hypothetical protein
VQPTLRRRIAFLANLNYFNHVNSAFPRLLAGRWIFSDFENPSERPTGRSFRCTFRDNPTLVAGSGCRQRRYALNNSEFCYPGSLSRGSLYA